MITEHDKIIMWVDNFTESRTDRMDYEENLKWLAQMEIERPTQIDLGKDVKYSND